MLEGKISVANYKKTHIYSILEQVFVYTFIKKRENFFLVTWKWKWTVSMNSNESSGKNHENVKKIMWNIE